MTTPTLSSDEKFVQSIKRKSSESEYSTELQGHVINVQCSDGDQKRSSSKVKLTDRIDYNWEFKYYHGNLVSAHINRKVIAYAMKGKDGGMIRVVHQESLAKRALIKNLKDDIKDLSFAYSSPEIILGCVDCEGNILIYNIEDRLDSLNYTLLLHVFHQEHIRSNTSFRLAWCPYVASNDEELYCSDESEKMFVVLNGKKARIYNVAILNSNYGNEGPLDPDNSYKGYSEIESTSDLVDASFSSDGCAIALAYQDGYVKFFQLFMSDSEVQKCLHEWIPHDKKPLTSVIFVDNILEYTPQCWKFAITGAENNTELKLWSCETWTCLQTIVFVPNPNRIMRDVMHLTVRVDYTGKYLVVSDIYDRGIYILELQKNEQNQLISAAQISHFLVPAPFLSFHILEASRKNVPFSFNQSSEDLYMDEDDFDDEAEVCVQTLKMLVIQPKKFQECTISFQPEALINNAVVVNDNEGEELEDLKNNVDKQEDPQVQKIPELTDLQNSLTLLIQQQQQQQQQQNNTKLTLMTPDDFTSPGKMTKANSVRNSVTNETALSEPSDKGNESAATEFQKPQKDNFASAGSSPSREVQEILSLNNSAADFSPPADFHTTPDFGPVPEYYNNLGNLQIQVDEETPQKDYSDATENTLLYNSLGWRKMPVVKETELKNQTETNNDVNKQDLETIYLRINRLQGMIGQQADLMQELHRDVKTLSAVVTSNVDRNGLKDVEITKEIENMLAKHDLKIATMLENVFQFQKSRDREIQESLLNGMNQIMLKIVSEKVPQILQHEIKHTLMPNVHQMVESYCHRAEAQVNQKANNMDIMLRESFGKALNNKPIMDNISACVVNVIIPNLEKSYRDIIKQSLVPSWEKACAQMFQQLNETFSKGTKEYTASVENYMERQRRVQDKGKDLISQMQNVSDGLKSTTDKLTDTLNTQIQKQFTVTCKIIQDKLVHSVQQAISNEVKLGFKNQASIIEEGVLNAVRSRAVTPAPHADSQIQSMAHVQQCLAKHNYDEAFQVALSAENLKLVVFTCEQVDVNKVLGEQCLLSQSVLLALMQQLSMELHKNTDTKLCFIRAAFLSLSLDDAQTRHFIPKVLGDLVRQLKAFMQTNPPLKQVTEARLLTMAVENMSTNFANE